MLSQGTDRRLFRKSDFGGDDLGLTGRQRGSVLGSYTHIIDQAPPA